MTACVELGATRYGAITIGASIVCSLGGANRIYLISSEGYKLLSGEGWRLYTETLTNNAE